MTAPTAAAAPRVCVLRLGAGQGGTPALPLPPYEPAELTDRPDAVVVLTDGDPQAERWRDAQAPVLVVLPPGSGADRVLAAFADGADACVRAASGLEVDAHLTALLRRHPSG